MMPAVTIRPFKSFEKRSTWTRASCEEHFWLGCVYEQQGMFAEAIAEFRQR